MDDSLTSEEISLINIDVNHYIKDWVIFMKKHNINGLVKVFYLASIGLLILCTRLTKARKMIKMLLVISLSPTDGQSTQNDGLTTCERYVRRLTNKITGKKDHYTNLISEWEKESAEDSDDNYSESESDSDSEKIQISPQKKMKSTTKGKSQ